ncbi:unnamed protein product, partial [Ectocarpus sp. 6 AP-2014]
TAGQEAKRATPQEGQQGTVMPKHKKEKSGPGMRHQPLATQIALDGKPQDNGKNKTVVAGSKRSKRAAAVKARSNGGGGGCDDDNDDDEGDGY